MASQLPRSSLETGSVWTQLMDDLMGRVAASSYPYGATVSRGVPPRRLRMREDSWLGSGVGTNAKIMSRSQSRKKRR